MRLLFIIVFAFCCSLLRAQREKNIFLEIGGSGGLGSLNYERSFVEYHPMSPEGGQTQEELDQLEGPIRWTLRMGIGTSPIDKNNGWVFVAPVMINRMSGARNRFEFGAGFAPSVTTKGSWFIKSPLQLGYRWVPRYKNYFIRVTYTPIVAWLVDFQVQQWFGISIGYHYY